MLTRKFQEQLWIYVSWSKLNVCLFIRAYLHFGKALGLQKEAQSFCMSVLSEHYTHIQQSHWRGIPELTNKNGDVCHHSNPIQAWSMACLLEVLKDIE